VFGFLTRKSQKLGVFLVCMPFVPDNEWVLIQEKLGRVDGLEKRVAELEARLAQYENSNTPPSLSSVKLHSIGGNKKKGKPGRSVGHEGAGRKTPEQLDQKKLLKLKICPDCGRKVKKKKGKRKRIVTDIQPGKAVNTELDIERGYCEHCKKIVEPVVAEALPNSRFGLTLALYITFLSVLGITLGKIRSILLHDYNLVISKGAIGNIIEQVAEYLGSDYEKLRLQLLQEKDIFGDETSHPINGKNAWLWTFIGKTVAYLTVQKSRGQKVVKKVLNGYNGILHSDFWSAYNVLKCEKQKCLARLRRHLHFVKNKKISKELKWYATRLLNLLRYAVNENKQTPAFRSFCEKRLHAVIDKEYADKDCRRINKTLRRHANEIFLFAEKKTETTNNHAERSIRPWVIKRKNTYGSYSIEGAQAHAIMASFYQTSQLQRLEYEPYVKELIQNQLQNRTEI
jgi:ssDNA-binding Zn-finger/Zn-ribbon topoisomerase 1